MVTKIRFPARYRLKVGGRSVVEGVALDAYELAIAKALTDIVSAAYGYGVEFEVGVDEPA